MKEKTSTKSFSINYVEKEKKNYKKALEYYKLNLEIWDQLQQEIPKAATFLNIGIAQANLNNHKQAYESFHFGLKIAKKHNLKRDLYRYYNNLANNLIAFAMSCGYPSIPSRQLLAVIFIA